MLSWLRSEKVGAKKRRVTALPFPDQQELRDLSPTASRVLGAGPVVVVTGVERLSVLDNRGFGATRANLNVAKLNIPRRPIRITRAQPNRLL